MSNQTDLLGAKRSLSVRLLRASVRTRAPEAVWAFSVDAAVATAGRQVHAVGVGVKQVHGVDTAQRCIRLYVARKLPLSLLSPRDVLPKDVDGIPTDVVESPPASLASRKKKKEASAATSCTETRRENVRPVVAGISAAHHDVTAGTIACFCRSTRTGDDPAAVYVLSNNHVFANVNRALEGDDLYQPGPADGGIQKDHFADLCRFIPMAVDGVTPNRVDAAIGKIKPDVQYVPEICSIGKIEGVEPASEGTKVRKHGRTTGYTEGVVTDDSYDALVRMDHQDPSVQALFEDQIRIGRIDPYPAFALGGDSGSLIVHQSKNRALGLFFAGPPGGEYGIANPIEDVLRELEIQML